MVSKEHFEQVRLFNWLRYNKVKHPEFEFVFAIPNGGARGGTPLQRIITGRSLKDEGVKRGVPDVFFPIPSGIYHGLFIELKAKGGRVSPEQKGYVKFLNEAGYSAVVCFGYEEAISVINTYLALKQSSV
jgi:hypothetical protein